jgi:hypothetical protein
VCRLVRPKSRCDACEALKRPCIWGNKKILRVRGKEYKEGLKAAEEAVGSQEGGVKRKRVEAESVGEQGKSKEGPAPKKRVTRSQVSVKGVEVAKKMESSKGKEKEKGVDMREEVEESTRRVVEEVVSDVVMTREASPRRGKSFFLRSLMNY